MDVYACQREKIILVQLQQSSSCQASAIKASWKTNLFWTHKLKNFNIWQKAAEEPTTNVGEVIIRPVEFQGLISDGSPKKKKINIKCWSIKFCFSDP